MVNLTRIYTRTGDDGTTGLGDGSRTAKDSLRIAAIGDEINDIPIFVTKGLTADQFYQMVVDQFDLLYMEGEQSARVMCIALHPFVINLPFRQKYLDQALEYITSHDKVWVTTSDEIADWYYENYYDQAVAQMRDRAAARHH